MKIARRLALAAVLAAVLAAPAQAQDAETVTEMRCILLSGKMASVPDPQVRQSGTIMAFYYLGRLDKKFSAAELTKRLSAEATLIDAEKLRAASTTCSDQLTARGAYLADLGNALSPKAKAEPK